MKRKQETSSGVFLWSFRGKHLKLIRNGKLKKDWVGDDKEKEKEKESVHSHFKEGKF